MSLKNHFHQWSTKIPVSVLDKIGPSVNIPFRPKSYFWSTESESKVNQYHCKVSLSRKCFQQNLALLKNLRTLENAAKILFLCENLPHVNFENALKANKQHYAAKIAFLHFSFTIGFGSGFVASLSVHYRFRPKVKKEVSVDHYCGETRKKEGD